MHESEDGYCVNCARLRAVCGYGGTGGGAPRQNCPPVISSLAPSNSPCRSAGYVDVAGNVACFAVVGEMSGAYKSETVSVGASSVDATVRLHTFMGGARVAARINPKLVPFGQVFFGAARLSGGVTALGPAVSVIAAIDADTAFALQIGGGLNLMTSGNFGVRLGADYRPTFISGGGENEFRLVAGGRRQITGTHVSRSIFVRSPTRTWQLTVTLLAGVAGSSSPLLGSSVQCDPVQCVRRQPF